MNKRIKIFFLILGFLIPAIVSTASEKDSADWWINIYGVLSVKDNTNVERVHEVFKNVLSASDKRANRFPRLIVLRHAGVPWAISLKDGTVLLTEKAMAFCYNNVSAQTGDSRVAFVLGHELAHLAKDDFWHLSAFENIQKFGSNPETDKEILNLLIKTEDIEDTSEARRIIRKKELQADAYGLLYATMAGYDPYTIVDEKGKNFFRAWADQLAGKAAFSESTHPDPENRAAFLLSNIKSLKNDLDLFHIGVRLYQIGRHEDALDFLMAFNEKFPCREVFNNIGLIHYAIAMKKLAMCDEKKVFRFKLATLADMGTMAEKYRGHCGDSLFNEAKRYFKVACEKDYLYLPARINYSSALIMSGKYSKALAILDEAVCIEKENPDVMNNRAVALYLLGPEIKVDMFKQSKEILQRVIKKNKNYANGYYNLARLEEGRNRGIHVVRAIKKYINTGDRGAYFNRVIKKADRKHRKNINKNDRTSGDELGRLFGELQVFPGEIEPKKKRYLSKMEKAPLNLYSLSGDFFTSPDEQALVLEDVVELIEKKVNIEYSGFASIMKNNRPYKTFNSLSGSKTFVYKDFAIDVKKGVIERIVYFEGNSTSPFL